MERRQLGQTDMEVSVLGVGGAELQRLSAVQAKQVIYAALDAGVNLIDTAECYGQSETFIGQALAGKRQDVFLCSKLGHAAGLPYTDWDPQLLLASIERSLSRLQTEYIDLIQLHSCPIDVLKRGEMILMLQRIQQEGKARYLGYSGNNEAARYAILMGIFDVIQLSVNIADQQEITSSLPYIEDQALGGIAKRPLANVAWLQGLEHPPADAYHYNYWKRLQVLNYPFLHESSDSAVEIALRFTLSIPGVHTAIVGTTHAERWRQHAQIVQHGKLSPALYQAIRQRWKEVSLPHWEGQV